MERPKDSICPLSGKSEHKRVPGQASLVGAALAGRLPLDVFPVQAKIHPLISRSPALRARGDGAHRCDEPTVQILATPERKQRNSSVLRLALSNSFILGTLTHALGLAALTFRSSRDRLYRLCCCA